MPRALPNAEDTMMKSWSDPKRRDGQSCQKRRRRPLWCSSSAVRGQVQWAGFLRAEHPEVTRPGLGMGED